MGKTGHGAQRPANCKETLMQDSKYCSNGWERRGTERKGPTIVKGLSHEILNTVKMDGKDGARSAKVRQL